MLPHIVPIQYLFLRQYIDPAFDIGNAWERFVKQEERRMKPTCYKTRFLLKILLILFVVILFVYRSLVLSVASTVYHAIILFNLGLTTDGYSTLWCHVNNNSALNCEIQMQTHFPSTSPCVMNLGPDTYNFCGA